MVPAQRIQEMPASIFAVMSKLAQQYNAINLGQGFPDFDGPVWIMDEAYKAMRAGKNQYAPMNGISSLRKILSRNFDKYYGVNWEPDTEITITTGATEAMFSTIMSLINPKDEVILFEPFYDSYQADVLLAGGIPRYVTLKKPDFKFDFKELEKLINNKTRVIILNSPHNPTGKVFSLSELEFISNLAIRYNLLVISDEVYEFLLFDDYKHIPIVTLPGMRERTITISSSGKTFGMTGWKIGFAYARPKYTQALQKIHQWTTFAVNTPGQHAMAFAFDNLEDYLPKFKKMYQEKRDMAYNLLKKTVFKPHLPSGSYFMMVDIPINSELDDIEISKELVINKGVATIPPSVFYGSSNEGKSMLRLCFAKENTTLKTGIEKLKNL